MKTQLLSTIVVLLTAIPSLSAQDHGWETGLEVNIGKGLRSDISKISCGVDVVEGYSFPNGLYLGGGIGFGYADGLEQDYQQVTVGGTDEGTSGHQLIDDVSWTPRAFIRTKYEIKSLAVSPFFLCDFGYRHRLVNEPKMNTGFFVSPGIGGSFTLAGKKVYGILSFDSFRWTYELRQTPYSDKDPVTPMTLMTHALSVHLGINL